MTGETWLKILGSLAALGLIVWRAVVYISSLKSEQKQQRHDIDANSVLTKKLAERLMDKDDCKDCRRQCRDANETKMEKIELRLRTDFGDLKQVFEKHYAKQESVICGRLDELTKLVRDADNKGDATRQEHAAFRASVSEKLGTLMGFMESQRVMRVEVDKTKERKDPL